MLCASPRQPCSVARKPGWHAGSKVRIRSREASRAAQDRRKLKRMQALIDFIGSHATKLLGALTATVSYLNAEQIIPNGQLKYYTAVLAVLTIWRGIFSGNAYNKGMADATASSPFLSIGSQIKVPK